MFKKQIQKPEQPTENQVYPWRILLVDDDPFILTMISAWLEDMGYEIKTSENGFDAVSQLPIFKPHLVITDLRMEDMDGIALLKEIHKYNSVLPVIIVSGNTQISDAVHATPEGVFEFLTKPIDPEELFRCVRSALRLTKV